MRKMDKKTRSDNEKKAVSFDKIIEVADPWCFSELSEKYIIKRELGRGSYGTVYKVKHRITGEKLAVKRILPTIHGNYILMEILFLQLLKGQSNIIELIEGIRKNAQISLVFNYVKTTSFYVLLEEFTMRDIKNYMYQLLSAVAILGRYGIVHRDIKPSNFLYSTKEKKGYLIDYGLSEIETDAQNRMIAEEPNEIVKRLYQIQTMVMAKNRTGTKGYLAPETIFKAKVQTKAVDVWAAGVIFLSFLAKRHPILSLHANDKVKGFALQNLIPLIYVFGTRLIKEVAFKYDMGIAFPKTDELPKERTKWRVFCQRRKGELEEEAIDLLDKLMELHPEKRITAENALKHPFFDEVRDFYLKNNKE